MSRLSNPTRADRAAVGSEQNAGSSELGGAREMTSPFHLAMPYHGQLITRRRLLAMLPPVREGGVVNIVAGPGYGKTALVVDILRGSEVPAAYLQLEQGDRRATGFLRSLAAAVTQAHAGLGPPLRERLAECRDTEREILAVLTAFLEEANACCTEPTYLAVDDVTEVEQSPAILSALEYLLQGVPSAWTVLLTSRGPLPIDLEPLRNYGRVVDIGPRQLRLAPGELVEWSRLKWDVQLGLQEARALWKVTEGWPLALTLLGGRLRGSRGRRERLREELTSLLQRGERLNDYLTGNVFDALDAASTEVILSAVFLPEVSFPREASFFHGKAPRAEAILSSLVESGFMLARTGQRTYVLHPLLRAFAEKMQEDTTGPDRTRSERLRAAAHLESVGDLHAAVALYLKAEDVAAAINPLRVLSKRDLNASLHDSPAEWLQPLPEGRINDEPWLLMLRAKTLQEQGKFIEAEKVYQRAARLFQRNQDREGVLAALLRRAFCLYISGRWDDSLGVLGEADSVVTDPTERAELYASRGNVMVGQCRWDEAVENFELAVTTAPPEARLGYELRVFNFRARLFFLRGELPKARDWTERVIARAARSSRPAYVTALNTAGTLEYMMGRYDESQMHAEAALALVRSRGYAFLESPVLLTLAGVSMGKKDYRAALGQIKRAQALSDESGDIEAVVWAMDMQGAIYRRNRNPQRALEVHRAALELIEDNQLSSVERVRALVAVGIDLAALQEDREAETLLGEVVQQARQANLNAPLAQALFYLGWLEACRGDEVGSANRLTQALELMRQNRYLDFLHQESALATPILALCARRGLGGELLDAVVFAMPSRYLAYYEELAEGGIYPTDVALGPPAQSRRALAPGTAPMTSVEDRALLARFETLTDREMEILRQIAFGLPNKVIGAKLFITEKTIKTHANKIYRKLEVGNRLQAVLALQRFDRVGGRRGRKPA